MIFKRFTYENGLDIISPLKCGTRWLEQETNPTNIELLTNPIKIQNIKNETYWLYRNSIKHLLSALKTEIGGAFGYPNLNKVDAVIDSFLNDTGVHWSPNMFKFTYEHWNRVEFKLIELNNLSSLFPNIEFNASDYNMDYFQKITNNDSVVIDTIPYNKLLKLYDLIDLDKVYLNMILNGEHTPIKLI
jgi:hypothetical protein